MIYPQAGRLSYERSIFMKILAIEKELDKKPAADMAPLLEREARRAWELYQSGTFREIYFMQEHRLAVIMLEAENAAEAKKALDSLPLVKEGYIDFDVMPLAPYPGFARLFK
jgi:muconolactone delta-isomerase